MKTPTIDESDEFAKTFSNCSREFSEWLSMNGTTTAILYPRSRSMEWYMLAFKAYQLQAAKRTMRAATLEKYQVARRT
jgi:hypothetical protein